MKRIHRSALLLGALVALIGSSAQSVAADTRSKDEKSLRDLEAAWSKVAGTKDVDRIVSYYADDASVFPPNGPIAKGTDEIKKVWTGLVGAPGFSISWETTTAVAAKSGDLGYTSGTYQLSMSGPDGKPISDKGKYVTVWRKTAGKWKVIADIFNSDLPANPPKQG
jgi:ketosteroid isomerase-like protein